MATETTPSHYIPEGLEEARAGLLGLIQPQNLTKSNVYRDYWASLCAGGSQHMLMVLHVFPSVTSRLEILFPLKFQIGISLKSRKEERIAR